jgi:hypothetical protein
MPTDAIAIGRSKMPDIKSVLLILMEFAAVATKSQ